MYKLSYYYYFIITITIIIIITVLVNNFSYATKDVVPIDDTICDLLQFQDCSSVESFDFDI